MTEEVAALGDPGAGLADDSFTSVSSRRRKVITAAVAATGVVLIAVVAIALSGSKNAISTGVVPSDVASLQSNLRDADSIVAKTKAAHSKSSITRSSDDGDSDSDDHAIDSQINESNITTIGTYEGNNSDFMAVANSALPIAPRKSSVFGAKGCALGEGLWNLLLVTDDYPWETKWELYSQNGVDNEDEDIMFASGPPEGTNYRRGTKYTGYLCLPSGDYYIRWYDLRGDSICCEYGNGEWTASVNGNVVTGLEEDPSDDSSGFKLKDYPFSVPGSIIEEEVKGTFLMRSRSRPHVELADGTIFYLFNPPPDMGIDNFENDRKGFVSGETLVTIPAGSEFFSNGTADLKGEPFRVTGKLNAPVNRYQGQKSVLMVLANAANGNATLDETSLSNSVFGNGIDAANLVSQFSACSYGKLSFVKAPVRRGSSSNSGDVSTSNGVVTASIPTISAIQGDETMRNYITKELNEIFSVASPSELADYVIYCIPPAAFSRAPLDPTTKIGYAFYGGWLSVFNSNWCTSLSLQMHEMGHLLNFGHSNEGDERYEDRSGYMGPSYRNEDGPQMCFNAAKSFQTGWYKDKEVTINSNSDATNCFDGVLHGVADYPVATTVLLKIQNRSGKDYFVTFNSQRGINVGTQEAGNEVTVVSRPRGARDSFAESQLVAKLVSGKSHAISGYEISVGAIDANVGTAKVTVLPKGQDDCKP